MEKINEKRSDAEYNQQIILTTMEDLLEQGEDISTKKMSDIAKISGVELVHYIVILKVKHCYVRLLWIKSRSNVYRN